MKKITGLIKELRLVDILKIIVGAAGWVWFIIPMVFSGIFNIGNISGALFFGVFFLWGIFGKKLKRAAVRKKALKVLRIVLITGYSMFTVLFAVESVFMINALTKTPPPDSTLIVLGCAVYGESPSQMLRLRLDAAEKFLKENPQSVAVLSGGQGENEDIPEALCMYRELIKRGISEDRLYMEDRSTSTRENIAFSVEIIENNSLSRNIAVVTNNFHLYRASITVSDSGYDCYCVSAYTPLPLLATYVMREYLGIFAQWVTG